MLHPIPPVSGASLGLISKFSGIALVIITAIYATITGVQARISCRVLSEMRQQEKNKKRGNLISLLYRAHPGNLYIRLENAGPGPIYHIDASFPGLPQTSITEPLYSRQYVVIPIPSFQESVLNVNGSIVEFKAFSVEGEEMSTSKVDLKHVDIRIAPESTETFKRFMDQAITEIHIAWPTGDN